jgi:hypothetical protein
MVEHFYRKPVGSELEGRTSRMPGNHEAGTGEVMWVFQILHANSIKKSYLF